MNKELEYDSVLNALNIDGHIWGHSFEPLRNIMASWKPSKVEDLTKANELPSLVNGEAFKKIEKQIFHGFAINEIVNIRKYVSEMIEKDISEKVMEQLYESNKDTNDGDWSDYEPCYFGDGEEELVVREELLSNYTPKYLKQLKQQLKHAKNPMETRQLNKKIDEVARELKERTMREKIAYSKSGING